MRLARRIDRDDERPRGYGPAYVDRASDVLVCYPLGLHLVVALARAAWLGFVLWGLTRGDRRHDAIWLAGYQAGADHTRARFYVSGRNDGEAWGYSRGRRDGAQDARASLSRVDDRRN